MHDNNNGNNNNANNCDLIKDTIKLIKEEKYFEAIMPLNSVRGALSNKEGKDDLLKLIEHIVTILESGAHDAAEASKLHRSAQEAGGAALKWMEPLVQSMGCGFNPWTLNE